MHKKSSTLYTVLNDIEKFKKYPGEYNKAGD